MFIIYLKIDNKVHYYDPEYAHKESEENGDGATDVKKSIGVHREDLSGIEAALKKWEVGQH